MKRMIWYEWKRIWQSRLTQFAVIGCILFLLFCTWSNIRQIQTTDSEGNQVTGMAAVKALKETERITLDQETVTAIMQEYLDYTEKPATSSDDSKLVYLSEEMYRTCYLPRMELMNQIISVYFHKGQEYVDDRQLLEENLGRDFYEARKERVQERLTYYVNLGSVTPSEADWWDEQDDKVGEYTYGNYKVWEILISNLPWVLFIMMVICVGIAPVFAGEYQSKCDSLLLCMKHGKHRLILAKLAASTVYASVLYWGIVSLYSAVLLIFVGKDGWDLPVQLIYSGMPSSYALTTSQAYLLALLAGYVVTLGLAGLVLFLSALFKNPYVVIVTAFLYLCVPLFLSTNSGGYLWVHLLALLPEKISEFHFASYIAYSIGNIKMTLPTASMIVNGLCAVVFSGLAYFFFRRHQVNR